MRNGMRKTAFVVIMMLAASVGSMATASTELRERIYTFSDHGVIWKPLRTQVICDVCPHIRRPSLSLSSTVAHKLSTAKIPATKTPIGLCSSTQKTRTVDLEIPGRKTTVYFDFDSNSLKQSEMEKLRVFTEKLKASSRSVPIIEVTGYTDVVGNKEYNDRLAFNRAFSVYHGLEALRVPGDGIRLYGRGKCCYSVKNAPASEKNRRAEVIEIKKAFASGKSTRCKQPVGGRLHATKMENVKPE